MNRSNATVGKGSRVPWILLALLAPALIFTLTLSVRNHSFSRDAAFISVAILMMLGYAVVSALLASRAPRNPIGWLMMGLALVFLFAAMSDEYVTYAYVTAPGSLPLPGVAASLTNWVYIAIVPQILLILILFPDGRVPSLGWRSLPVTIVALSAVGAVATILRPGPIDSETVRVLNPTGVESLRSIIDLVTQIGGLGLLAVAVGSLVAPIVRFRRAADEERQQLRWLVTVVAIGGALLLGAIVSGIGLQANETRLVNELFFWAFFVSLGIGVVAAIAVAVLKYRLYDLEIIVKKTVVFADRRRVAHDRVGGGAGGHRRSHRRPRLRRADRPRDGRHRDRAVDPAAVAPGDQDRRSARLRGPGDAVRGAHRVLGADGRHVFHGGRPPAHGRRARRGSRRDVRADLAPRRPRAPFDRRMARGSGAGTGVDARGRAPRVRRRGRVRGPPSGGAPRRPHPRDAGERPDDALEGTPRAGPRFSGGVGRETFD